MIRRAHRLGLTGAALLGLACGAATETRPATLLAAASLREVVTDLVRELESAGIGPWRVTFAGSNALAQQILAAPAAGDLYLSADRVWVDRLVLEGLVTADGAIPFAGNRLVVVVPPDSEAVLDVPEDLTRPEIERLVLADPRGVPAGRYARRALKELGLWTGLEARVVPAVDVRSALALVAATPGSAGIVYATDAAASGSRVRVCPIVLPAGDGIRYWAVALPSGRRPDLAGEALDVLLGPRGKDILRRHGFTLPGPARVGGAAAGSAAPPGLPGREARTPRSARSRDAAAFG